VEEGVRSLELDVVRRWSILLAVRTIMAHLGFLDMYPKAGAQSGDGNKGYRNDRVDAAKMAESSGSSDWAGS